MSHAVGCRVSIDRKPNHHNLVSALIADDDEYFRIALRNILSDRLGVTHIIETESFDEAIERLSKSEDTDLVVLDLEMPGMTTRGAIRTVRESFPNARVVVVSASCSRLDVLCCLEAGAHGYVHKGIGPGGLTSALQQICDGTVFVPSFLPDLEQTEEASAAVEPALNDREADVLHRITPRQTDVLRLLIEGRSNKGIARKLGLSESAVKFHLSALFRHFGASNRVEAATQGARLLAMDHG